MELISLGIAVLIILVALVAGRMNEKAHYRSIIAREEKFKHIMIFNEKLPPMHVAGQPFHLVNGSVVISADRFKQLIANILLIFGGRISSFESMLDRGRREAILRMKERAHNVGATMIFNTCLTTTILSNSDQRNAAKQAFAEILAYGTAWVTPRV